MTATVDARSQMGSQSYNRSLLVYPVLKVGGIVSYAIGSNLRKRQMEHSPLNVQVRNLSISLCRSPGKALYSGERSVTMRCSVPEISEWTDR